MPKDKENDSFVVCYYGSNELPPTPAEPKEKPEPFSKEELEEIEFLIDMLLNVPRDNK